MSRSQGNRQRSLNSLNMGRYTGNGQLSNRAQMMGSRSKVDSVMSLAAIANGIMDPYSAKVPRVCSGFGNVERTVVAQPYDTVDLDFTVAPQADAAVGPGQQMVWLFRDPLHAYATSIGNGVAHSYVGNVYFQDEPPNVPTLTQSVYGGTTQVVQVSYLQDSDPSNTGLMHPYGNTLYGVRGEGRHGFWVDANPTENAIISFTIGASAPAATSVIPNVVGYFWANGQWVSQGSEPFSGITTGSAANYTTAVRGYYAFEIAQTPLSPGYTTWDFSCQVTYTSDFFAIRPCPQVESYTDSILRGRVTAASILLTWEGQTLYDGGQIAAAQFSSGTDWWNNYSFTTIADQEDAYDGQMKTGLFGFLKPNDSRDLEMRRPFFGDDEGNIWSYVCDLSDLNQYVACIMTTGIVDGTYAAGIFRLRVCYGFEYVPRGNWFQALSSANSSQQFSDAMSLVSKSTQFYANFAHLAAIARFLLGAVQTVGAVAARAAPYIATAAQVADAVRTGANLVSKAAVSKPQMVVQQQPQRVIVLPPARSPSKAKRKRNARGARRLAL